ncbi:MAG: hypothetical protein QOJ65_2655 [Fimbriimonadaceae bacterium]|jgi:hypothetical protein|nr:hypothetical protein [Fimbriimonadaceae bacterium]
MKSLATDLWFGVCVVLLALANAMLFLWFMLMMGFWSRTTIYPLFYVFFWSFQFSYYWAAPIAAFGFLCSLGCSYAKQTERASLLAILSGGALCCAIIVWTFSLGF